MKRYLSLLGVITLIAVLFGSTPTPVLAARPNINKDNFHHPLDITNPYFPLKAGTTFIYKGTKDGTPTRDVFVVTHQTKTIMGIPTRVIHDTLYEGGVLVEKTDDWFAQDDSGNVWYMGEATAEYNPNGTVNNREGSWEGGVKGAQPGIVMQANSKVGDTYRQELAKDIAQDKATVLSLNKSVCVPTGCYKNVLETKEFSPLEPGVVEHKFYAAGVGQLSTVIVKGGSEQSKLVSIKGGK